MARIFLLFMAGWGLVGSLRGNSLESARRARWLLRDQTWAEVIGIERARRDGPGWERMHALVFELEGRLWYYAEDTGTESLSNEPAALERDKRNLAPRLRELPYGCYRSHRVIDRADRLVPPRDPTAALPLGCFVESLAYFRGLVALGETPATAKLLAYYGVGGPGRAAGHTVLYFEKAGRRFCFDPGTPAGLSEISNRVREEALAIALAIAPVGRFPVPERARFLALSWTATEVRVARVARDRGGPAAASDAQARSW